MQDELKVYQERLHAALCVANLCIFEVNLSGRHLTFFDNAEAVFGRSGAQIMADISAYKDLPPERYSKAVLNYFSHPEDEETILRACQEVLQGRSASYEARMRTDGGFVWCKMYLTPICENGKPVRMVIVAENNREERKRLDKLELAAGQDSFTKLYNKQRGIELCEKILRDDPNRPCSMLVMDIDNFKTVNDTHGHIAGDEVLLSVAQHLRQAFRRTDVVARFGGDEFVVLMPGADLPHAVAKAHSFLQTQDNAYGATKSIGIAVRRAGEERFESLFKRADIALYRAKDTRNRVETEE